MKIFISHSSKDKWAARRISEDLILLGAQTYLDEKDIETGQSIDLSIRKNLKDCDDFLIILSPASLKSEWVLLELGGALALEKKIIPILLYVGVNEVPHAINLKLSRDINLIQLYYNEVRNNISGTKPELIKERIKEKKAAFEVGDKVKVVSSRPQNIMRQDSLIDWEPEMDSYLGQESTISLVNANEIIEAYGLEIDETQFVFAKEWLIPIK